MTTRPVVGLDLSLTRTGVVFHDGTSWSARSIPTSDRMALGDRLDVIAQGVLAVFRVCPHALWVIEQPISHRNGSITIKLAMVHGVVRVVLRGEALAIVGPTVLKRWATGSGNASKDDVGTWVEAEHPEIPARNPDERDAAVLALMGRALIGADVPDTHRLALLAGVDMERSAPT